MLGGVRSRFLFPREKIYTVAGASLHGLLFREKILCGRSRRLYATNKTGPCMSLGSVF